MAGGWKDDLGKISELKEGLPVKIGPGFTSLVENSGHCLSDSCAPRCEWWVEMAFCPGLTWLCVWFTVVLSSLPHKRVLSWFLVLSFSKSVFKNF